MGKELHQAKLITQKLISLHEKCKSLEKKYKFLNLSISYVNWLAATYTIDLTNDILLYTQDMDVENYLENAFKSILRLLKTVNNRLNCKN